MEGGEKKKTSQYFFCFLFLSIKGWPMTRGGEGYGANGLQNATNTPKKCIG